MVVTIPERLLDEKGRKTGHNFFLVVQTCALNEINSKRGKLFFNLRASETDNHFASSHCAALMS